MYSPVAGSRPAVNTFYSPFFFFLSSLLFTRNCVRASMCIQYYVTLFLFVFSLLPFLCCVSTGCRSDVNILFMHITLGNACCLSCCWCCRCCSILLLNLHAHKSCAALLLLYVRMVYSYGLPFVVGLPLLLFTLFYKCVCFPQVCVRASMCIRWYGALCCFFLFCFPFFCIGTGYRPKANIFPLIHITLNTASWLAF